MLWLGLTVLFGFFEGLQLGKRNVLKVKKQFQTRKHLEEIETVGTNIAHWQIQLSLVLNPGFNYYFILVVGAR